MTPEQIKEIKERIAERKARKGWLWREEEELIAALAALEESQQTIAETAKASWEVARENVRLRKEIAALRGVSNEK